MEKIKLETERLILTEWDFEQEDISALLKNFNNKNINKTLLNPPWPYTEEDAKTWLSKKEERKEKGDYCFKIIKKEDKSIIGHINLTGKIARQNAEMGYWLCEEEWGNGYMTEAAKAVVDFGFSIGFHKIFAKHFVDNLASGRVMQKCGMKYEGTQKEQIFKDGIYHDVAFYGIINKKEK